MKNLLLILAITLVMVPSAHAQKKVKGTVKYSYELKGEDAETMKAFMPEGMEIRYGKDGVSVLITGGMYNKMMGKIIMNDKTGETFMVRDDQKTVYMMSDDELNKTQENAGTPEVTQTDETKDIMGYSCKKYIQKTTVQGTEMDQVIWATDELVAPKLDHPGAANIMGQNLVNTNISGFPMAMEMTIPQTNIILNLVVTGIDFKKIKKSEFERPEDYEVKDFSQFSM